MIMISSGIVVLPWNKLPNIIDMLYIFYVTIVYIFLWSFTDYSIEQVHSTSVSVSTYQSQTMIPVDIWYIYVTDVDIWLSAINFFPGEHVSNKYLD